jgi:hypothetical protein
MRELFPGYYRPTQEQFQQMWQECIFVLDAKALCGPGGMGKTVLAAEVLTRLSRRRIGWFAFPVASSIIPSGDAVIHPLDRRQSAA